MRARSASAPSVRSRPNQRALSIESASRLDRLSIRSRCSRPYTSGTTSSSAISPTSAPRARERRVEAAAGQRREPALVGMDEPVVDEHRVRGS